MLLLLPTRLLKPWSYYRLVANFETQADIRKFTTFIWEKISVRKQITREVWPRCTNKHTRRLARHSRMRWHTSTRQRESLKVQKDEEDQSAILTACVSRNRELLTWAITLILNDNNQFPKYSETELLNFELVAADKKIRKWRCILYYNITQAPKVTYFRFGSPCSLCSEV